MPSKKKHVFGLKYFELKYWKRKSYLLWHVRVSAKNSIEKFESSNVYLGIQCLDYKRDKEKDCVQFHLCI